MMMPANFSAIAENEMSYVNGGYNVWDYMAPVMEAPQWSNVQKGLIIAIGDKFAKSLMANTVDKVFSGSFVPGDGIAALVGNVKTTYGNGVTAAGDVNKYLAGANGVLNAALYIAGNLAAIYSWGFVKEVNGTAPSSGLTIAATIPATGAAE